MSEANDTGEETRFLATMVPRAAQGEELACRALFVRYHPPLMAFCLWSTRGERDRAKDLAQDVLAACFQRLAELKDPARFRGWLFTIAANHCQRQLGREKRRGELLERFLLEQEAGPLDPGPDHDEREQVLAQLVTQLDDEPLRRILKLKYGEPEHTTREIAEALGIPHGTVTVKLMRARAQLKRQLLQALVSEAPAVLEVR